MSGKFSVGISVLVCSVLFIVLAFGQSGSPITGQWTMGSSIVPDRVQLTIQCCGGTNSHMNSSLSVPLSQIRGLTGGQPQASGVTQLQITRAAGTFQLQGFLQNGNGGGTFTF